MADDTRPYPVTTFALRVFGQPGWMFDRLPMPPEDARRKLSAEGHDVRGFRVVSCHTGGRRTDDGQPSIDTLDARALYGWNWYFDPVGRNWYAPEEMMAYPRTESVQAPRILLSSEAPDVGWWIMSISAGGRKSSVAISHVFDPIDDLLDWLERVARKWDARILIDCEGQYRHLLAFAENEETVRFVVDELGGDAVRAIDVRTNRGELVSAFVAALQSFFSHPAYPKEWETFGVDWDDQVLPRRYHFEQTRSAIRQLGYNI